MKTGARSFGKFWKNWKDKVLFFQVLLMTAGVLAVIAGIYRDEVRTVLTKAIYICLECIGIG